MSINDEGVSKVKEPLSKQNVQRNKSVSRRNSNLHWLSAKDLGSGQEDNTYYNFTELDFKERLNQFNVKSRTRQKNLVLMTSSAENT